MADVGRVARVEAGAARLAALGLVGGLLLVASSARAIVVAPHALFIDHRTRSAVLYLQNPGDLPEEFTVRLQFGYPVSDSLGGVHVELFDQPAPGEHSAAGWIRALPARAIVRPGERQAVRLLAQPPPGLPDGEYWSRVVVESRAAQPPVAVSADEAVQVGLTLEMRTITSLTYRKGPVTTGVEAESIGARLAGGSLICDVRLRRVGDAAYLGNLDFTLLDQQNRKVGHWEQLIAVYHALYRRLVFPVDDLRPGSYRLRVRLTTEREDIAPRNVLPARPIERIIQISAP